ncbi:MAG TPA: outer membrane lipoprotein carrier protein LolA [Verrucomicrobiae bacterium]|jgi:outer membrane lipoprotein-sorting protein|nr:outer membrane lipoprotein carrier protein LolA [Verrucomicrobiae bacterium]
MKAFFIFATAILTLATFAADDATLQSVADPQPVLQDLQHKMSSLGSVYFELTQERHLKLFTEPLIGEGFMLIERPDQIRWETTAPYQSILLGDKKSVAQFEFNDGKWEKLKLGFPQMLQRVMSQMSLMNQGKLDALTSDYTISVSTNSEETILTLVPKDENARTVLAAIEVKMTPDFSATREVVMHEPNGDFTRIIFHREKRDVKFPAGTFDQTKPLDIAAVKTAVDHAP